MDNRGTFWAAWFSMLAALLGPPGTAAAHKATDTCPQALTAGIPARPSSASTGSDFVRRTAGLSELEREAVIVAELLAGDVPGFLRHLKPVTLLGRRAGKTVRATICVTPDYLALGSDDDFLRIPMGLQTAVAVAARFGFVLPTPKMVDAIYQQAEVHLRPQPLPPGPEMRSTAYYSRHNARIQMQRRKLGAPLGLLVAGQKKDLVLTNRLRRKPGRVAIYGWHRGAGQPIQPLSTVHGARYADYSHGVRLVSAVAFVDGKPRPIFEVLEDPALGLLLSDEGPLPHPAELVRNLADQGLMMVADLWFRSGALPNSTLRTVALDRSEGGLTEPERGAMIAAELLAGNVPPMDPRSVRPEQADRENGCTITVAC
jgi:hypothetical protein